MKSIGNVQQDAQIRAVASGALSNGDTILVNSDGTVSAVAGSAEVIGSATVYETGTIGNPAAIFDSSNNKVVIAYTDQSFSDYGTAVVGTVSGSSISFGTPVVFSSAATFRNSAAFDSTNNKVVIAYSDYGDSRRGKAIVGTVSGTSISFGSAATFESGSFSVQTIPATVFDPNSGKVGIFYQNDASGADGTGIVGTVSGTSISFGSKYVFESGSVDEGVVATFDSTNNKIILFYENFTSSLRAQVATISGTTLSYGTSATAHSGGVNEVSATYDSQNQRVVVTYQDNSNAYTTAAVGTVSGTSISFGTPVVFNSNITEGNAVIFDTATNQVLACYGRYISASDRKGYVAAGTVSGTSISFNPATLFSSAQTDDIHPVFDSNSEKAVISWRDYGNSSRGTALVYAPASTNLTSDNFIGFSGSGYLSGQNVGVDSTCSVNREQTGLTAGQKYYVQTDGSLSETAGDPSVLAGTAISSTEILVKG